ncbi:MAG: hypothetical protein AAF562_08345 [Pseudomonadota bacterium]
MTAVSVTLLFSVGAADYDHQTELAKTANRIDGSDWVRVAKPLLTENNVSHQADEGAWASAKAQNTIKAYQAYLNLFPTGRYTLRATSAINAIREERRRKDEKKQALAQQRKHAKKLATTPFKIEWERTFGGADWDSAYDVITTADGGFLVAGQTASKGAGKADVWVIKLDNSGKLLWDRAFGGNRRDGANGIAATADGGFLIVGHTWSKGAGEADIWAIKIDSTGNLLWDQTFGGAGREYASRVITASDGGFAILGSTRSTGAGGDDVWVIRTDSKGNKIWDRTFGTNFSDTALGITKTVDKGFLIAGNFPPDGSLISNVKMIKIDGTGKSQWETKLAFRDFADQFAYDVSAGKDSGFLVSGWTTLLNKAFRHLWVVKLDQSGNQIWNRAYDRNGNSNGQGVLTTSDGGIFVAADITHRDSREGNVRILKLDRSGNPLWNRTFGGSADDRVRRMISTPDGGLLFTGWTESKGAGKTDMWVIKLKPPKGR